MDKNEKIRRNVDNSDVREVRKSKSEIDVNMRSNLNWSFCECLIFENLSYTLHTIHYTLHIVNYTLNIAQYKPHTVPDMNTNFIIH